MTDALPYDPASATHVHPKMREFVPIEGKARIEGCWNKIWVPTDSTREAFAALDDCRNAGDDTKPRGLVIVGESDTGKSRTLTAYRDRHPPTTAFDAESTHHPVVLIDAPNKVSQSAVLHSILEELNEPITYRADPEMLKRHTVRALKRSTVRLVMIDEFHDISHNALNSEIVSFLAFIKSLVNGVGRPFVVSGIPRLIEIVAKDPQIAGRLNNVVKLTRFTDQQFQEAVLMYELMLPLRLQSKLVEQPQIMQKLHARSQGYIGLLSNLLRDACITAIEDGTEKITLKVLENTRDKSIHAIGRRPV